MTDPILKTITFYWATPTLRSSCRLHDKTMEQAMAIAKEFGFREYKWYKPGTWKNQYYSTEYYDR